MKSKLFNVVGDIDFTKYSFTLYVIESLYKTLKYTLVVGVLYSCFLRILKNS